MLRNFHHNLLLPRSFPLYATMKVTRPWHIISFSPFKITIYQVITCQKPPTHVPHLRLLFGLKIYFDHNQQMLTVLKFK